MLIIWNYQTPWTMSLSCRAINKKIGLKSVEEGLCRSPILPGMARNLSSLEFPFPTLPEDGDLFSAEYKTERHRLRDPDLMKMIENTTLKTR